VTGGTVTAGGAGTATGVTVGTGALTVGSGAGALTVGTGALTVGAGAGALTVGAGAGALTVGAGAGALTVGAGAGALAVGAGAGALAVGAGAGALAAGAGALAVGSGAGALAVGAGALAAGVAEVAACACRENTSKTIKIPAATTATCTARRAMCRKASCGMSSSHPTGTDRTELGSAHHQRPETPCVPYFGAHFVASPRHLRFARKCTHCSVITVQHHLWSDKSCSWRLSF
jgi:X-X-X-Leu-X-X-Gly heptad repeat protein